MSEDVPARLEKLRASVESISSELDRRALLAMLIRQACELLGAEHGIIGLPDENGKGIRTEATHNIPPEETGARAAPLTAFMGRVLTARRPIVAAPEPGADPSRRTAGPGEAQLGVTVEWAGRVIGVIGVGAPFPRRFGPEDGDTLSLFARHAAIALENARRFEREKRRTERFTLIARIAHIITANLQLGDLLQRSADAIHDLLGYPYISIAIVDPDDPGVLSIAAASGIDESGADGDSRIPVGTGIVGRAAASRKALLADDVRSEARHKKPPEQGDIRSALAIPLMHGDELLGVLNVESQDRMAPEDQESMQAVADQIAVAIENARLYARARHSLDETRLLYHTSHRISTAMDVEEVIRAYLEQVAHRTPCVCSVALYDSNAAGERTAVVVRGKWSPEQGVVLSDERYPYAYDDLDPLLDAGQAVTIHDVHTDPRVTSELRAEQQRTGCPALAMIPLLARGWRIGLVVLSYPRVFDWPASVLEPFRITATQLASALDSRRQNRLLFERSQQVAALEERHRIARDLHDSVSQVLFSMTLIARSLDAAWKRDPVEGSRRVDRLLELSRSALAEMRALLTDWQSAPDTEGGGAASRPGILLLRDEGIESALRRHLAHSEMDGLETELDTSGYEPQPPETEEALFRLAQETMNNIVKHAGARRARIRLGLDGDWVTLRVEDDGRGFVTNGPEPRPPGGGLGLPGMRKRVESLGGRFHLLSAPEHGTTVDVRLPARPLAATDRMARP